MKYLICILLIGIILQETQAATKAGDCLQAYCGQQVKDCREQNCDAHVQQCSNKFKKQVGKAQKEKTYKGTEHALDDVKNNQNNKLFIIQFNYCMSTNSASKALNSCRKQHCTRVLLQEHEIIGQ